VERLLQSHERADKKKANVVQCPDNVTIPCTGAITASLPSSLSGAQRMLRKVIQHPTVPTQVLLITGLQAESEFYTAGSRKIGSGQCIRFSLVIGD